MSLPRFAAVGLANTAVDYGCFTTLVAWGTVPQLANLLSVSLAVAYSFFANRSYTFAQRKNATPVAGQLIRHLAVTATAWCIPAIVIAVAAPITGALAAKALAIPLVFAWNYALSSRWVWSH